jgi:hypothetical protein
MKKAIFTLVLILFTFSIAAASNLHKVEKAIKEKGASWKAGETSLSRLSDREQRQLLGVIIDDHNRANPAPGKGRNKSTPRNWDWRDAHGQNWVTPVSISGLWR